MKSLYPRRSLLAATVLTLILGLFASVGTLAVAQESLIPEGAPVDIHSGTCEDFLTEPTHDGGEIGATTSDEVWGDEQLQAGMLIDDAAGISGVDLNGDQTLQPDEVVLLNGENEPVGKAQADLEEAVDTSQPLVVVVHAGADTYETVLACGALNTAQEVEGGRQLTMLQAQGDFQLFGYAVLDEDGQALTTYLYQPNPDAAGMATPVQAAQVAPEGYPVDIHEGTCQDWTTEPVYDVGNMQKTNVAAEGEQEPGDVEAQIPQGAETLGDVYKVDAEADFGGNDIFESGQPHVVAIHENAADGYTNLIACGQILQILDDDQVIVILQPVGDSGQTGFLRFGQDAGQATGLLWNCAPLQAAAPEATPTPGPTEEPTPTATVAPTPSPTPEPSPTATLAPTPTEEATAVVVETVVTTETEVVPAPTGTAAAEGTP